MADQEDKPISLIINADDFGYFSSVSRGIAECARQGVITATGIMANGPRFAELKSWLDKIPYIDLGVHLNITYGKPLSTDYQRHLAKFKGHLETAALIMQNAIPVAAVKAEWRAQIERCLEAGLTISFLNTHEHIHLLPMLAGRLEELAQEYGIEHIRHPRPEWIGGTASFSSILRNLLMHMAIISSGVSRLKPRIQMIGNLVSGKLDLNYLKRCFAGLVPGRTYELMCHPGFYNPNEIQDSRLCKFHAWEQELNVLTGFGLKSLMRQRHIQLTRFSELSHKIQRDGGDGGLAPRSHRPLLET
jgi:predicted glycoside hydrolase/deacetylase ChbG (UPF0249 family)